MRTLRIALIGVATSLTAVWTLGAAEGGFAAPFEVQPPHVETKPRLDGSAEEPVWQDAPVLEGFVQREPREGAPATERTAVRVIFDDAAIYFSATLEDSQPDQITAALHGRDVWNLSGTYDFAGPDDSFAILLDTFGDGRNGYYFAVNPNGAMTDALITGEGLNKNFEWDGVWHAVCRRTPHGWAVEISIPFKTLRYRPPDENGEVAFGLNFQRIIRRKNEEDFWSPIDLSGNLWWFSRAGQLTGLRPATRTRVAELKPFFVADAMQSVAAGGTTKLSGEPGLDARLGLTSGLALDLTLNTDFAQVEVDEQQVNFTRFSLFFPEKREFFLEGAGIFNFGFRNESKLFFSRRIGLDEQGNEVPLLGGAKVAGKAGRYELGAIVVRSKEGRGREPGTQTVLRARRQLFTRSSVGVLMTDVHGLRPDAANQVLGIDADVTVFKHLTVNSFWARSFTRGRGGDGEATNVYVHWDTDTFGIQHIFHDFGADFSPELGFFPRTDIRRQSPGARIAWRPTRGPVRRYLVRGMLDWFHDHDGVQRTRHHTLHGIITLENGDELLIQGEHYTESPEQAFRLGRDTRVPAGVYTFERGTVRYTMSPGRRYGATMSYSWGGFYGGTRREAALRATAKFTDHLAVLPAYTYNEVHLPYGSFASNLAGLRVDFIPSNRLITNAFLQYNDVVQRFTFNLRVDFIYRPNSHIYLVWNEGRDTSDLTPGLGLEDRAVILKIVHLFRR